MNRRYWVVAGWILFVLTARSQTDEVFKVWRDGDKWYGKNLTKQPITAYVVHAGGGDLHLALGNINIAPVELVNDPIVAGATEEIRVKPVMLLEVPAVIFEDGTVVGNAKTVEGMDIVQEIFNMRRAEYTELKRWASILNRADHHEALVDFRREVATLHDIFVNPGMEDSGRNAAVSQIRSLAGFASSTSLSDEEIYNKLVAEINKRVEFTEHSSTRTVK